VAVNTRPRCITLPDLPPLAIRQVRSSPEEPLFNALVEAYHYLGYTQAVGEHRKYLVFARERPLGWSSAPRQRGPRDRFIGWSSEARRRDLRALAYNARFLILPWVQVPNLASQLLGRMAKRLAADWDRVYALSPPLRPLRCGLT